MAAVGIVGESGTAAAAVGMRLVPASAATIVAMELRPASAASSTRTARGVVIPAPAPACVGISRVHMRGIGVRLKKKTERKKRTLAEKRR